MKKLYCIICTLCAMSDPLAAEQASRAYWEAGIGLGAINFPDYLGSSERNTLAAPWPYIYYQSERLSIDRNAVQNQLFENQRWSLKLTANGSVPVDSDDNERRRGMPDLLPVVELGPLLQYDFYRDPSNRLRLELPVRAAIASNIKDTRYIGIFSNPNIAYEREQPLFGHPARLTGTFGPMFADSRYHDYFYSVEAQYALPDRPAFDASGGFSGWRVSLGLSSRVDDLWIGAFVRYHALAGASYKDSPLLEEEHSFAAVLAIAWVLRGSE